MGFLTGPKINVDIIINDTRVFICIKVEMEAFCAFIKRIIDYRNCLAVLSWIYEMLVI